MANTPINAMTATFGSGLQTAIKMNVTSDSSDAGSKLIDLQTGGTSKFSVTKEGYASSVSFSGKITGSVSGSVYVKNNSSIASDQYLLFAGNYNNGTRIIGADGDLVYNPQTGLLTTAGDVTIGGDIDSVNPSTQVFPTPTTLTVGSQATAITVGNAGASSYTRFLSKNVRGNFTGSFTGSLSGSRANFNKLSGSNSRIKGRVIATSFTGSISGSRANFTKLSGSNGRIVGRLIATSFTGSISGAYASFGSIIGTSVVFDKSRSTSFTGSISGSRANFTKLSGSNSRIKGRVIATSFTGSISGSTANFTKLSGSSGRITGRVVATSFTGSISGSRANFTKLSGSNSRIAGRVVATNFTGSISGSRANFTKLSGSSGNIENDLIIQGTLELFNAITGSNSMFISGAGSPIAGYIGIKIGGTKYKLPLYPWS